MQKVQGFTEAGNTTLLVSGITGMITREVQGSFPGATVTVYDSGTVNLASIFSDDSNPPTAKANPFISPADGSWSFYVAQGSYDVQFSGAGLSAPFTIADLAAIDPNKPSLIRYAASFPGADAGAKMVAAVADLPSTGGTVDARGLEGNQTISQDVFNTSKPVKLLLGAGNYTISAVNTITNPYSSIEGLGPFHTQITCSANSDCIRVTSNPWVSPNQAGYISGFAMSGNAGANACGIHVSGIVGFSLRDVLIQDFSGTSGCGLWLDHGASFSDPTANFVERFKTWAVDLEDNTHGLRLTAQAAATSNIFDFEDLQGIWIRVDAGQTGIYSDGGGVSAGPITSRIGVYMNCVNGGTMIRLTNGAVWYDSNEYNIYGETTFGTACTGVALDASTLLLGTGAIDLQNGGTVASINANATLTMRMGRNEPGSGYTKNFIENNHTVAVRTAIGAGGYGSYIMPDTSTPGGFRQGYGSNLFFDGSNWITLGTGLTNIGAGVLFDGTNLGFYASTTTGGTNRTISSAALDASMRGYFAPDGLHLGNLTTGSAVLSAIFKGSADVNWGTINANTCSDTTVGVTGAIATDSYYVSSTSPPLTGIVFNVFGASASAPTVRACNITLGNIVVGTLTMIVDAWRH